MIKKEIKFLSCLYVYGAILILSIMLFRIGFEEPKPMSHTGLSGYFYRITPPSYIKIGVEFYFEAMNRKAFPLYSKDKYKEMTKILGCAIHDKTEYKKTFEYRTLKKQAPKTFAYLLKQEKEFMKRRDEL